MIGIDSSVFRLNDVCSTTHSVLINIFVVVFSIGQLLSNIMKMSFYNHTLLAVQVGRNYLEAAAIPSRRPLDFFCENMKSDAHMIRVGGSAGQDRESSLSYLLYNIDYFH